MSDYMFKLESHLSPGQSAVLAAVQTAASEANISLFLTGGAMRDMLGGFPIRDLDFTVEGSASKLAHAIVKKNGANVAAEDEVRKLIEIEFPSGLRCEIGMARSTRYGKPGAKPHVSPATIHEDLRGRDFTVNAIALSLNRASRGLMIDPTNGADDLLRRELRSISNYSFYDDPVRMFRLLRLKARLDFAIEERTASQFRNAREAGMEAHVGPRALYNELRALALEPNPAAALTALDEEKLTRLFSPGLTGAKLNLPMFGKLEKAKAMIPFGAPFHCDDYSLGMYCLTQLLSPKEKAALLKATAMTKAEQAPWANLEARARKLETVLKSPKLNRASLVYDALRAAKGEEVLYLFLRSAQKNVPDRIRNYFTKYLSMAMDVSDEEVIENSGLQPADKKFAKARLDRIHAYLEGRVRKPVPPPEEPPPPPPSPKSPMVRGARFR